MKNSGLLLLTICFTLFFSCQDRKMVSDNEVKNRAEPLIIANKGLIEKDNDRISAYIARHNYKMKQTQTGLWYEVYFDAKKKKAVKDNIISLKYKVTLLNGKHCYSSDSLGPMVFRVGQGGVESGLEEGILLLGIGDKARFILPPYLAHGLMGDGKKIPRRSIIIYEVEVLNIVN